jgi:hypothetical protein
MEEGKETNENEKLIEIDLESVPRSPKTSPRSPTKITASAPPPPDPPPDPMIDIALKFTIIKSGSEEADYNSVTLYDLITKKELSQLKKEYDYIHFDKITKFLIKSLSLNEFIEKTDTEKSLGQISLVGKFNDYTYEILHIITNLINSITDIINNKVDKHLNIHLSVVKKKWIGHNWSVIMDRSINVFNSSLVNIHTPNEEDLRMSMQTATTNSWTLYINSHSNFYFNYPPAPLDNIVSIDYDQIIHLLYYGKIGLSSASIIDQYTNKEKYEADFFYLIIKYLYKIKNFKLTDSRMLNQLIIDNKIPLLTTFNTEKKKTIGYFKTVEELIANNNMFIQKEEERINEFTQVKLRATKPVPALDSFILTSQSKLDTYIISNVKLTEKLTSYTDILEVFDMYLDKLEKDLPFFNIITLGLTGKISSAVTRLYKNKNFVILKRFDFDEKYNNLKIMNVKSTNPVLNELNELDLRVEEDKLSFLEILSRLSIEPENIEKITNIINGDVITMGELACIGKILGLSITNIISSGCNNYSNGSLKLTKELLDYLHDDPNGLAFGVRTKKQLKHITRSKKQYRLNQHRLNQHRLNQHRLNQKTKEKKLKQRSRKTSRKTSRKGSRKTSRKTSRKRLK